MGLVGRRPEPPCFVRHPTEWGGAENVVPPPAMGRRRGGHPHSGVLLVACWVRHPTEWGGEERVVPPRPQWAGGAVDTRIAGSCWRHVGLDTPRSGVEKRRWSPPPAMGRRRGGRPHSGVLLE